MTRETHGLGSELAPVCWRESSEDSVLNTSITDIYQHQEVPKARSWAAPAGQAVRPTLPSFHHDANHAPPHPQTSPQAKLGKKPIKDQHNGGLS